MAGKKLAFSKIELDAIQAAERISSVFSVFGSFFVIITFLSMNIFRKPINRLVFLATWGNLATNLATLISRSGIMAGVDSPLCQMQAFIIQICMPADSLWTLSMALNVYLTFFHRFSGPELVALEKYYLVINYGLPFIPAMVFLQIGNDERGPMFGDATLWCWITVKWNTFRIATFYGPVWVVLLTTMTIYILVGRVVFQNKARFRELTDIQSKNQAAMAAANLASNPPVQEQGATSKTTEVRATMDPCSSGANRADKRSSCIINIEAAPTSRAQAEEAQKANSADRAAWSYLKCALLFFTAMVVTWVPATINRVGTLIDPTLKVFGLNFSEALLLPLQGFFNAMIYIAISTDACNYLRAHCKRVFREIFINSWKRVLGLPIPHVQMPPKPDADGYVRPAPQRPNPTQPLPPSCGSVEMAPRKLQKAVVKPIQPQEMEEYERLHKKLNISPEPGSTAPRRST
ncbi:hypothetical protein V493_04076 [Pseudogymnoascus sp. VKM F-4281 (FW-2241)]|nr:hypothetical protein V493_04076 [Pseudogymnoascus sp. VKM F-4281 (FW-2241)]